MLYVGCDQHRKQITVCVLNEAGEAVRRRQVSTQPEKIREFLDRTRREAGEEGFMAIVEVCGFNDWFLELLREYGCREVVLIHPGKPSKRKTDRRDASKLSEMLWVNRGPLKRGEKPRGLRRVVIPSRNDAQDRQVTSLRQRAGRRRTRVLNALQGILRKHNLQWEQPTKHFDTLRVREWLKTLELPEIDRLEMDHLLAQWALYDEQIEQLDAKIAERAADSRNVSILRRCKGLGAYGALGLASRIGDVRRFPRPRSLANYFGLTPACRNTGDRTDRLGSITKEGSRFARFILGQLVLHVLKHDTEMRTWYRRIKRRRGSKIARVAVMRRLCTIFWHMLTHDEPYRPGGPPRLRERRRRRQEALAS